MALSLEISLSYPYRWISEAIGVEYWVVLSYSDAENKEPSIWSATERAAVDIVDALPSSVITQFEKWMTEARMRRAHK